MNAKLLDGIEAGKVIEKELSEKIIYLKQKKIIPSLAVILVGADKPSHTYVQLKHKKCQELGISSKVYKFEENIGEKNIIDLINELNNDDNIHGILVQLPLPKNYNQNNIIDSIFPEKDVDGFHPLNIGKLAIGKPDFISCTPYGVIKLLEYYNIPVKGKNAVIIGCSNVVGKPMGLLLQICEIATCTICHLHTKNIKEHTLNADLIISAAGSPNLIKSDMVKKNCVVIDVGFNVSEIVDSNGGIIRKINGDVDFENVKNIASYITPVPGGVGPMTITMLMYNTVKSCFLKHNLMNFS
ncbi:bifunctional methylenetetrahydrofolate dehydrogenase/methenyltetrahydrofolate cyclohydrolase [Candidatus Dependentiae bacterium]|nr:bifunctional methylenetetrahydrofolate dehydrogenase/methenyltetrahydrofolate cyclohydrolase [Candidatus Dependentiae bacterium]